MRLPAMFVCLSACLSVSKITQKRMHGFGWNFDCRQVSGHGRTDQLSSPIRIVVRMPELENRKSKVGQTGTSLRAGYRSRDALQRDTVYSTLQSKGQEVSVVNFFVPLTVAELRSVKVAQFSDSGLFSLSEVHALHRVPFQFLEMCMSQSRLMRVWKTAQEDNESAAAAVAAAATRSCLRRPRLLSRLAR